MPTNVDYVSVNLDYFVNNFLYQSTFQTNLRHLVPYDLGSIWSVYSLYSAGQTGSDCHVCFHAMLSI